MTSNAERPPGAMRPAAWPAAVQMLLDRLTAAGFQAYLVGGCVRDLLLHRPVHDYDIATDALPAQVISLFQRTAPTGLQHGTVTVLDFSMPMEVTTFRIDAAYSDGRRPDRVSFTRNLIDDLARRDFTINAMAIDRDGRLHDPFHGQHDLQKRQIRAVGKPEARFSEDGLRILRGLRFAAELGFTLEPATLAAMHANSRRLAVISNERIGQEFARIAAAGWKSIAEQLTAGPYLPALPAPWPKLAHGFAKLAAAPWDDAAWLTVLRALHADLAAHAPTLAADDLKAMFSLVVWCVAAGCTPQETRRLVRQSAWPRSWGNAIVHAVDLGLTDPAQWTRPTWRWAFYTHPAPAVFMACAAHDVLAGGERGQRASSCVQQAQTQPLWSLRDLAVSGEDAAALGAAGPDIGRVLRYAAAKVLAERLPNDRAVLLRACASWLKHIESKENREEYTPCRNTHPPQM